MANTDAASGNGSVTTSQSGGWGDIIPLLVNVGSSLLGGYASGQGGKASSKAEEDAARQQLELYRQIYGDQRALALPNYYTSGNAMNLLASQYGLPAQNYMTASQGGGGFGGGGYGGANASNNWGAGQPVQGHSGGGGPNALASAAGTAIGSVFGGPVGGAVGGFLGGLVRNGGDNWQTLATGAPQGFDYNAYMQQPDLAQEWGKQDVQSLFNGNKDAYAYWHYNKFGKGEGRTLNPMEGYTAGADGMPVANTTSGSAGGVGQQGGTTNPLAAFWASPHGQLAEKGFLSVDQPEISGAFGAGGKALSGAATKALFDRSQGRAQGAYNDYTNGIARLAGLGSNSLSQIGNAGSNYAIGASGAMGDIGRAKSNALTSAYSGWGNAINGTIGAVSDFGKKNWGWA